MALFNRYQVETPESVVLEFTLAGIGNRLYALLIDYLCLGGIIAFLVMLWGLLAYNLAQFWANDGKGQLWLMAVQLLLIFAAYVGYFVVFETLWQGQTPGKRWTKIRVIREDGRPVGLTEATLRALLRPVDDWLYVGAIMIIFDRRERRLGDWLAGTLVIREGRNDAPRHKSQGDRLKLSYPDQAAQLAQQLRAQSQLGQLTPDHWLVIRDYLLTRQELLAGAKTQTSQRLAHQVKTLIHLPDGLSDTSPEVLLEAVYLAGQEPDNNPNRLSI
jgi:uncharacterized RDD family membrane protein YckC